MIKVLATAAAIVWIILGLIVLPMPIPLGAIMIATGIILLVSVSAAAALRLKAIRRRFRHVDKIVRAAEDRLPGSWRRILERTDP